MTTTEQIARSIADDVPAEALQTHRSNVEEWLKKAVAAEARAAEWQGVLRMYKGGDASGPGRGLSKADGGFSAATGESASVENTLAHFAYWRWLDASTHARVFRSMAARAEGIYDRLVEQKALYEANQTREIADLERIHKLETGQSSANM